MEYITPEKAGISSKKIEEFIRILESRNLNTHNIILSKGNQIFYENYWTPFHKDFLHRMYSVSKSFVSLAIGFLWQDGIIGLDDKIGNYFQEEIKKQTDENMLNQTIRHMLMMSTAKTDRWWFAAKPQDRVRYYFENDNPQSRPSGTIYEYDSSGSFVLCALVERLTQMEFMEYLRVKLFDKIGVSKEAYCLKCPGGHSWGDSGILCKPMDLWKVARFVLNKGKWNDEQILSEEYITLATTKQIDNNSFGNVGPKTWGYGYQFWMTYQNSFFFNGMGCQYAICVPEKDLIFVYNGDNQGNEYAQSVIIDNFFKIIVDECTDYELCENENNQRLKEYSEGLSLCAAKGECFSNYEKQINDKMFVMDKNPMGIRTMKFSFFENGGVLRYENTQGEKELYFGRGKNEFGEFPEEGYSDEIGTVSSPGHKYRCAASAAWIEAQKLYMKIQIIDKYFGNLNIIVGFFEDKLGVFMNKSAENFLDSYQGYATGRFKVDNK